MPLSLDEFTRQLAAAGLIPAAEWQAFLETLPPDRKTDGEKLARELVRQKKLTGFQAQQIYAGKGKALQMGNYTVLDKLGQGGMGVVLKARHNRMQRFVAIKVLTKTLVKDAEAIARFQREVVAASQLEHPNIVGAYDADEVNGQHILVMQYIEGSDLSSIVKRQGPLPLRQALDCLRQAARGLEYAHKRGVIHRDIKPANLLLDNEGLVKVLDMGLARFANSANIAAQAELTGTGIVMGTVDYMSPEQALNTKSADARSDIYSLGISLYYLLTGQAAYPGDSLMARLMAHANSPIPSLRSSRPDVPDAVQALFARAVAKQPGDRYQTMTELAADLDVCLAGLADQQANQTAQQVNQTSVSFSDDSVPPGRTIAAIPSGGGTKGVTARTAVSRAEYSMQEQGFKDFEAAVSRASGADAFEQTHVSQPTSATLPSISFHQQLSRSAPKVRSWTGGRNLISTGAAAVLLLAAIVFFIPTGDGVIRVEINDPEIAVAIKGTEIVLQQADQGKDVKLSPGEKTLVVRRDDFQFETGKLILKKGDAVTVRVELLDGDVKVSAGDRVLGQQALPTPARETVENPALPATGMVDLMPLVQADAPTSSPPWTREAGAIVIPSTAYGRALIDAPLPADYELHVDVEPLEGRHSVVLGLVTPRGRFWVPVSGWGDDKDGSQGATQIEPPPVGGSGVMKSQGRVLFTNKPSRLVATVHPDHVVLVCDGKTLIDWHGDATKGGEWGLWKLPEPAKLGIGAWQSQMRITRLELRPLDPLPRVSSTASENFALEFEGSANYVEIPDFGLDSNQPYTVEAWVTPAKASGGPLIQYSGPPAFVLWKARGSEEWGAHSRYGLSGPQGDSAIRSATKDFIPEQRQHVALCFDPATQKQQLFLNGSPCLIETSQLQLPVPMSDSSQGILTLGSSPGGQFFFTGKIDEVRISRSVRYSTPFVPSNTLVSDERTHALYHFEEGAGDILKDSSGHNHHGKIIGAKWVRINEPGASATGLHSADLPGNISLQFDGQASAVDVPSLRYDGSHPLTIEAWVQPKRKEVETTVHEIAGWDGFFNLGLSKELVEFQCLAFQPSGKLARSFRTFPRPPHDGFYHVAGVWNGREVRIFVDGQPGKAEPIDRVRVHSDTAAHLLVNHFAIGSCIYMGSKEARTHGEFFLGNIDELRVSRTARYDGVFTPQTRFESDTDTIALYHFDEGSGPEAKDSSGNGHHGKIVGAKWARLDEPRAAATDSPVALLTGPELFDVFTNDEKWQWSEPENLGSAINVKDGGAYAPAVSGDGLTLVFHSARPGSGGKWDLWMARRNRPDEPFSPPENLGAQVNSTEADYSPWLSYDGLTLLFITQRGANRIGDVWMATRPAIDEPFGPASPVPGNVNSTSSETGAALSGDGRMLIVSSSSGGNEDLGQSTRPDLQSPFGKVTHLTGDINSPGIERYPRLSSDGRFLLFTEEAVQEGEQSEPAKIWAAVRTDIDAPFGTRARVSIPVPKESSNGARAACATADGRQVFFFANNANNSRNPDRQGSFDLWMVRREPRPPTTASLRRGVEWALSIGGIVRVNNGPPPGIQSVDELPAIAPRQVRIEIGQNSQVTEAGLAHFQGCREVTWLHLGGSPITDAGLANFKDCHRLTFLALWGANQVTEAGLANFASVKNLRFLNLDEVGVTDSGLAHFHQCTQLQRLLLKNGRVTDAGLAPFADCRDLTELDLNGAKQITVAGLENFLSLIHLQTLGLAETQLTDAFLERLAGVTSLKSLNVRGTAVTLPAIEKLHARLPRCRIESEFGILEGASEPRGPGL